MRVCAWDPQEEMRQSVAPAAEPVQYYFTLAQQPGAVQVQGAQPVQQAGAQAATTIQPGQIIIAQSQQGQVAPTTPPPPEKNKQKQDPRLDGRVPRSPGTK